MNTRILILLDNGYEEIEVVTPLDIWKRAGYSLTLASINNELKVKGGQGLTVVTDTLLNNCSSNDYDILFIPGGAIVDKYESAMPFIKEFIDQKKTIVAICAAPTVLAPWLENKKATCYPAMKEMIPNWIDETVVIDLPFITSQGPGTAHDLAFEVVKHISGESLSLQLQQGTIFNKL